MKGVNLGGWLSQYKQYDHEHFRSFITAPDIAQIAGWGFDHVRLPVDYPVIESDDAPGVYREDGFQYIDACFRWCREHGLGLVFDLHHAPGYSFNNTLQDETRHLNTLFTEEADQQRFISLWEAIVRRYHQAGIPVIFELLNEIVLPESSPWNALALRTVNAIRAISPDCLIMIGGNHFNAASELANLDIIDDPNVIYTFHFYEPFLFTHQKAYWAEAAMEYNQDLQYPGVFTNLAAFLDRAPQYRDWLGRVGDRPLDRALVEEYLQPALDFARGTGRMLYCGEFGVIEHVDPASRRAWHADLLDLLRPHGIGWAVWSYKEMDFRLVDAKGEVADQALVEILGKG